MVTIAMLAALAMPPPEYDHKPQVAVEIVEYDPQLLRAACNDWRQNILFGCFIAGQIRIRNDMTPAARAKVLRHEYGHVNGWSHD